MTVVLARPTRRGGGATIGEVEQQPVSVLVVDDLASFRRAAAAVIAATDGFVLAGEVGSGEEAIAFLEREPVALILMDVTMPGIGGIRAAEQIHRRFPGVAVVLLSIYHSEDLHQDAASSGAQFRHKERFGPDELEALWNDGRRTSA
jgi:two-component system invasion response regulator UvrY